MTNNESLKFSWILLKLFSCRKHKSAAGKYKMRLNEKEVKIKQTEEHIVQVKNDLAIQLEPVNEEVINIRYCFFYQSYMIKCYIV